MFLWFWAIFDLKIGLLAKNCVGCSAPGLKRSLVAEFPGDRFFREHRYVFLAFVIIGALPVGDLADTVEGKNGASNPC